jgi:hypothetical protein
METAPLPDTIHHYTNINSLALILRHKKIRLNRLDKVDDLSESKIISGIYFGKYFFVSCWTHSDEESIPQWHMYTNQMSGVRISIHRELFKRETFKPDPNWVSWEIQGEVFDSPIPFNRVFTDKYIILPAFLAEKTFCRYVIYEDNLSDIFNNSVCWNILPDRTAHLTIENLFDLASYKKRVWSFQKEVRFILFILPSIPIPEKGFSFSDNNSGKMLISHLLKCLYNGIGPDIDYFDIDISTDALNNIEITLGPLATEGDKILVEALLGKYTTNGKLRCSQLSGTIRKPMK